MDVQPTKTAAAAATTSIKDVLCCFYCSFIVICLLGTMSLPSCECFLIPDGNTYLNIIHTRTEAKTKVQSMKKTHTFSTALQYSSSSSLPDSRRRKQSPIKTKKNKWQSKRHNRSSPIEIQRRLQLANEVESRLYQSLQKIRDCLREQSLPTSELTTHGKESESDKNDYNIHNDSQQVVSFPSVRDCNSVLAILGDTGDFNRALKLFGQMRKAQKIVSFYNSQKDSSSNNNTNRKHISKLCLHPPPSPTLVTYSTLMSRAISLGNPKVAIRLWRLMILQEEFYTNISKGQNNFIEDDSLDMDLSMSSTTSGEAIVPDIKAVNILMNVFAKMADNNSAALLMEQIYEGDVKRYSPRQIGDSTSTGILGSEEIVSLIRVVPKLKPNIVTYNTLIDACHRAGDLDAALDALKHMKSNTYIKPDARTYTSLIATVARRTTRSSGAKDPDLAFALFDEMVNNNINPNGRTYCALIDVCGRCGRSDLALKGLRMMLRENTKRQDHQEPGLRQYNNNSNKIAQEEVGAWSAAINACGKAGRIDTAIHLFFSMSPKFGVKPNIITCGCLMDCLLKSRTNNYLEEALNVLTYMKEEGIEPSEVMYTSLITCAGRLARLENAERGELVLTEFGDRSGMKKTQKENNQNSNSSMMVALDVYEKLLLTFTHPRQKSKNMIQSNSTDNSSANNLVKAFLVFQEMKTTGADPDIACYNALLRTCANAGDMHKIRDVMRRIERDGLIPNDTTWKEYLRGAANARQSAVAEEVWSLALSYKAADEEIDDSYQYIKWVPNVESFVTLIKAYMSQASDQSIEEVRCNFYDRVIDAYLDVIEQKEEKGFHKINIQMLHENKRGMSMVLKAAQFLLEYNFSSEDESEDSLMYEHKIREIVREVKELDCLSRK